MDRDGVISRDGYIGIERSDSLDAECSERYSRLNDAGYPVFFFANRSGEAGGFTEDEVRGLQDWIRAELAA